MRNYVIINGVNSLTIQGLAIKTMPPITKPIQRTLREEIDGRDGDLVTELGYGAYDKTIEIGLFGTFDIDEVIAFFNQKGTITFSNELDKVYNFQALEQVDYAELLKFRTANVVLHCQPFKYPTEEEPLEVEYEYIEATGTDLTLNDTAGEKFNKIIPKGNTSQDGTPTPSTPQPVHVVSGDNVLSICGKNLIPFTNQDFTLNNIRYYVQDGSLYFNGTSTGETSSVNTNFKNYFSFTLPAGTYTISHKTGVMACYLYKYEDNALIITLGTDATSQTFTLTEQTKVFIGFYVYQKTFSNINSEIMISITSTTYEPYIGQDYPIYLGVENLFPLNQTTQTSNQVTTTYDDNKVGTISGTISASWANITSNYNLNIEAGTYTISTSYPLNFTLAFKGTYEDNSQFDIAIDSNKTSKTFTTSKKMKTGYFYIVGLTSGTQLNAKVTLQLEKGSKANHYTPYGTTPIELCGIGDYKDKPFKAVNGDETYDSLTDAQKEALTSGSWYKYGAIGKVVLDSSKFNEKGTTGTNAYYISTTIADGLNDNTIASSMSDKFGMVAFNNRQNGLDVTYVQNGRIYIRTKNNTSLDWSTNQNCKDWLDANTPLIRYILATPTFTELTDEDLIAQLEAIKNATSYKGQTNITQTNNDMPFILDLSALKENSDHLVIDNIGNIYSKPTLDLEGTGIVDIYLNDTQMFEVDLSEKNEIVIDTEKMEAYNPTDNTLANRQVTGDYSKFKLDSGENDLRFSGNLTKATITNYERWL